LANRKLTPAYITSHIRRVLKDGGSAPHAKGVQWFFKEEIKSHGWRTADLRRVAVRMRRTILKEAGLDFLTKVADQLFSGPVLEERVFAVLMLEKVVHELGDREFRLFESWLKRIISWADHDGLVHYLIAPMIVEKPARGKLVFRWARSRNRWHRRAACVALI
jgi:3-methyladenine DNA glycosylase AlkD